MDKVEAAYLKVQTLAAGGRVGGEFDVALAELMIAETTRGRLNAVYEEQRVREVLTWDTILEQRHKTRMALIDLRASLRQLQQGLEVPQTDLCTS